MVKEDATSWRLSTSHESLVFEVKKYCHGDTSTSLGWKDGYKMSCTTKMSLRPYKWKWISKGGYSGTLRIERVILPFLYGPV